MSARGGWVSTLAAAVSLAHAAAPTTLDPQARAVLDKLSAASAVQLPASDTERIAQQRARHRAAISLSGPAESILEVRDQTIKGPVGPLVLRSYRPRSGTVPALVYLHGGGFVAGGLDTHDAPLRALANRAGCVIVAVDYRLAPEAPYPAALNDGYAALQWVAGHSKELGIDPARLAIGGDAAGGNLATVIAMMARDRGGPPLRSQLLIYPYADAVKNSSYPSREESDGLLLSQRVLAANYAAYLPRGTDRFQPYVSPVWATDLKRMPPTILITAEFDPLRDEGETYALRLSAAGVRVEQTRYPRMIHGFFQMAGEIDAGRRLIDQLASALKRHL